jgi:hypothetical protein
MEILQKRSKYFGKANYERSSDMYACPTSSGTFTSRILLWLFCEDNKAARRRVMNNELQRIWKESAVA